MKTFIQLTLLFLLSTPTLAQRIDWAKYFYGSNRAMDVTTDTSGNVYVIADIENTIVIGTDTFTNQYGVRDIIISKFGPTGQLIWGKVMGGTGYDWPMELAMDEAQNLYAAVYIQGTTHMNDTDYAAPYKAQVIQFDTSGAFKRYLSKNVQRILLGAGYDAFYTGVGSTIEKRDTAFNIIWTKSASPAIVNFNRYGYLWGVHSKLQVGPNGRIVIAAEEAGTGGTALFDTVTIRFSAAGGGNEICVINMDTSGAVYWARTLDSLSTQSEYTARVTMDSNGNVYAGATVGAGYTYFANDTLYNTVNAANKYWVIFKFDSLGTPQWARGLYTSYTVEVFDMLINQQQELLVCGDADTPSELAGVPLTSLTGGQRTFIAKLSSQGILQWVKNDDKGTNGTRRLRGIALTSDGRYATAGQYAAPYSVGCFPAAGGGSLAFVVSENPEPVPQSEFVTRFEGGVAYFENKSVNDDTHKWNFGDGQTDLVRHNPSHAYPVPGYYNVCLIATNGCGTDTTCHPLLVAGIEKVSPRRLANSGYHLLKITGGFPFTSGTVKFIKGGQADIVPDTVIFRNPGLIQANLKLDQAPLGDWDLVIISGGFNDTLFNAITLELPDTAQIEVQVSGAGKTLVNTVWPFRITLTNRSNRTEIGFPLAITMSPDATIFTVHEELGDSISQVAIDSIGHFAVVVDSLSGDSTLFGGFLIPVLSPGETKTFRVMVQSPVIGMKTLTAHIGHSYFSQQNLDDMGLRVMSSCNFLPNCLSCALDILGFVPGVGCVTGALNLGCAIGNGLRGGPGGGAADIVGSLAGTALSCAGPLGALNAARKAYQTAAGLGDLAGSISGFASGCGVPGGCHFYSKNNWTWPNAGSLDPNSKTGPLGLTPQNYVSRKKSLPYFIRFENIASATAPAREVMITDTLDASVFDLSTFHFTSFAFADSVYDLEVQDDMFVQDIDLRPVKNIILRVWGSLDTATNVVSWKFSSFDTTLYDLTTNISDGFLPPNVTRPEGEGYVTYSVDPLPGLPHLQQLANRAHITFDANAPIATDLFINTIDTLAPTSQVSSNVSIINDTTFTITWSGSDAHAGVNVYDIYVSENDGPFIKLFQATSKTTATLTGVIGNKYEFYSIATDHADNVEVPPLDPANAPDAVVLLNSIEEAGESTFFTSGNPFTDYLEITAGNNVCGEVQYSLTEMTGKTVLSGNILLSSGNTFRIATAAISTGYYSVRIHCNKKAYYLKAVKIK